jgi:pimeloyl-ACP methyl ester carboxylesterase
LIVSLDKKMADKCLRSSIPVLNRASSSSRFIEFYDYGTEISNKNPTVLYVPGFQGSGHGLKSQALIKHCQAKEIRYVCYDPEATGESKVEDMTSLRFQHWFEDAQTAIKYCKSDKMVLVGSSMGGWISLKMANENSDVICGLVLLAPAVNFLRPKYDYW